MPRATGFKPPARKARSSRPATESVAGELRGRADSFGEAQSVLLSSIADRPGNESGRVEGDQIKALVSSVEAVGVLVPVVVSSASVFVAEHPGTEAAVGDAEWVLAMGHRRCQAARAAGLTEVPIVVRNDLAGAQGDEVPLHENDADTRLALTPLQEARRYQAVMRDRGLSQRKLAEHLNKKQAQISRRLSLLELPDLVQDALEADRMTLRGAVEMASELKRMGDERTEVEDEIASLLSRPEAQRVAVDTAAITQRAQETIRARAAATEAEQVAADAGVPVVSWTPQSGARLLRDADDRNAAVEQGVAAVAVSPAGAVEWVSTEDAPDTGRADPVEDFLVGACISGSLRDDADTLARWAILATGEGDPTDWWARARGLWSRVAAEGDTRVSPGPEGDLRSWIDWAQSAEDVDVSAVVAVAVLEYHRQRRPSDSITARWTEHLESLAGTTIGELS